MTRAALVDVDGTLVDSNYHHVLAWHQAFRSHGLTPGSWRIHRHIGMGGDHLVAALVGAEVDRRYGDDIRATWRTRFDALLDTVSPVDGARDLLVAIKEYGVEVVLASSSPAEHVDRWLHLLDVRGVVDAWTTADDVEQTKPDPDLLAVAMAKVAADEAVTIGDSTWDCEAAARLGLTSYALHTGGFSEQELRAAGAATVYEDLQALRDDLDTVLGR